MSLHKSSVLVKLTIHQWDGFKKDKRVAERVDEEFKTGGDAGNYNKRLLDKSTLSPIQKLATRIRSEHARMTMPWCYDGVSLLPTKLMFEYTELMRDLKDRHAQAVDNLVTQYPIYKANQAVRLGALFRPEDYPSQDELRSRFGVSHSFFPVPQSEHFIVDLEADEQRKLKESFSKEYADTSARALESVYSRVQEMVEHVHERLSDPDNVFRDSLLRNIEQIVGVLPSLNVFNDPTLNTVCEELQSRILIVDAQTLRDVPTTREQVANAAFDIAALLRGDHLKAKAA